jgi:hypothetical protein
VGLSLFAHSTFKVPSIIALGTPLTPGARTLETFVIKGLVESRHIRIPPCETVP